MGDRRSRGAVEPQRRRFGEPSIDIVFRGYAIVENRTERFVAENAFVGDVVDCAARTGVESAFPARTARIVGEVPPKPRGKAPAAGVVITDDA